MRIYIPSMGRANITQTYKNLPPQLQKRAMYVVPRSEEAAYHAAGFPAISPPDSVKRIAATRQWIVEEHIRQFGESTDKLCMLDDDLSFHVCDTKTGKYRSARNEPMEVVRGFQRLEELLDVYAHGGIAMKLGSNRFKFPGVAVFNTRACRAIAFRASILKQHWPHTKFGKVAVQDDFHATLTLMELGYENAIVTCIVQEQTGGSGSAGGASTYRDMAYHAASVHTLKQLHPEFVRIVEKNTTTAWKGEARIDVVCSWKKAIQYGASVYGLKKVRKAK